MEGLTEQQIKEIIASEIKKIAEGSRIERNKIGKVKDLLNATLQRIESAEQSVNSNTGMSPQFPAIAFYVDDLLAALSSIEQRYT